jgi:frataxin-like iron-binding protein CyaY
MMMIRISNSIQVYCNTYISSSYFVWIAPMQNGVQVFRCCNASWYGSKSVQLLGRDLHSLMNVLAAALGWTNRARAITRAAS